MGNSSARTQGLATLAERSRAVYTWKAMPMTARAPTQMRVRVAGFWRRALASGVDGTILTLVFLLLGGVAALVLRQPLPQLSQLGPDYLVDMAMSGSPTAAAGLVLFGIVAFLYFFIFLAILGQTPGKRLFRVRVID